jgi:hypothetical protein
VDEMSDLRTAAQQALEALESTQLYCAHEHYPRRRVADALDALKAALEQPEQPVADAMKTVIKAMQADPDYAWSWHCNVAMAFVDAGGDSYTANQGAARFMRLLANVDPAHELPPHPPRREWRVLTEEDMIDIQDRCGVTVLRDEFIAIEAALKEKNHHE